MEIVKSPSEIRSIKKILLVDDEETVCKIFKEALERFGYEVTIASDGNEGMRRFCENPADLIITDIFMPEKDGYTFIMEIKEKFPDTRIFAVTGEPFESQKELDIAKTLGVKRIFAKPFKISSLLNAIEELSSCHSL